MSGTIRIEVDLELWNNSGREKHTDITEQGGWLANAIAQCLRAFPAGPDFAIRDLRYFGDEDLAGSEPVLTISVNRRPTEDEDE
jgi:hypothetical protein